MNNILPAVLSSAIFYYQPTSEANMTWTKPLTKEKSEELANNTCPNCKEKALEPVSQSGRTIVCGKCNDAYIKPKISM